MPVFVTTIATKSASRQSPKTSVRRPSESRIALNGVKVLARTIVRVDRLAAASGGAPRAARRAAASASVKPVLTANAYGGGVTSGVSRKRL